MGLRPNRLRTAILYWKSESVRCDSVGVVLSHVLDSGAFTAFSLALNLFFSSSSSGPAS